MKKVLRVALACAGCAFAFGSDVRYELLTCSKPDKIRVRRIEWVVTEGVSETVGLGYYGRVGAGGTLQSSQSRSERTSELELTLVEGFDLGIQEDHQAILDEVFRKLERYAHVIDSTGAIDQTAKRVARTRSSRILGNVVCAIAGLFGAGYVVAGLRQNNGDLVAAGAGVAAVSGFFAWLLNVSHLNDYQRYAQLVRRITHLRGCRLDHAYLARAYEELKTVLDDRDFDRILQVPVPEGVK